MKNKDNYTPPVCEEMELNLESTVLNSSFTLNDFEDGGEIW